MSTAGGHGLSGGARRQLLLEAGIMGLALVGAALLPAARPLPFDLCVMHRLTGLPCLTCGLTRSVCFLLQGDPMTSLAFHPAGGLVVLLVAVRASWRAWEAAIGRLLRPRALHRLTVALGVAGGELSAGAWIVRLIRI
jgi:hypothetical protein